MPMPIKGLNSAVGFPASVDEIDDFRMLLATRPLCGRECIEEEFCVEQSPAVSTRWPCDVTPCQASDKISFFGAHSARLLSI